MFNVLEFVCSSVMSKCTIIWDEKGKLVKETWKKQIERLFKKILDVSGRKAKDDIA